MWSCAPCRILRTSVRGVVKFDPYITDFTQQTDCSLEGNGQMFVAQSSLRDGGVATRLSVVYLTLFREGPLLEGVKNTRDQEVEPR